MSVSKAPSLCLIDGSSYFYRAFFAIRPLSTASGLHVNAIYGFTTMIMKALKDLKPDYVSIVFDSKEKTFRSKIYEDYKANRAEMPDELAEQIPYIKSVVDAFNLHALEKAGYEADDLIGTVCHRFKGKDIHIIIVSADKDLMQLVDSQVMMFDTMKDRQIKSPQVKEKFGVPPDKVVDVLSLMGDSSDNVPGVRGIGPKTAAELIQQFGSLDQVLKKTDQLKGKLKESLEQQKDQALMSRKLVTLDCDVPVAFKLEDFRVRPWNTQKLAALFHQLEFKRLLEQLGLGERLETGQTRGRQTAKIKRDYPTIVKKKEFEALLKKLKKVSYLTVDLETTSLDTRKAEIVGIALSYPRAQKQEVCYIPLRHKSGEQLPPKLVLDGLKPVLTSPKVKVWGQNIKYDYLILGYHGIWISHISDDSMIASYVLDPSERHNLDALSLKYLGHQTIRYADVTQKGKKQIGFDEVPLDEATAYAGEDADVTSRLVILLRKKLKQARQLDLYERIEMPLVSILAGMEAAGVCVDLPFLRRMSDELEKLMTLNSQEIYASAGEVFNIQSPKQLSKILFQKLKLPVVRKIKTGHSTNEEVLTALGDTHELPGKILAYREIAKLKSTYVDALIELADPKTGRVHTSYNQTVAATGRLSSSNPNLQNIPIRSELGQKIRKAFIAERGSLLLSADYSQVELRLLAHLSQDPVLMEAFQKDKDIHAQTAAEVFGVFPEMVTSDMRRLAKTINFGLIYGQSPFGLARQLKIPQRQARDYIDRYFQRYQAVKTYMSKTIEEAGRKGYVDTMMGRRRYLPELRSSNLQLRQLAERMAINTPVQGSAADLIKIAMIRISEALQKKKYKTRMILQVHDELVFEVPEAELPKMRELVQHHMENAMRLAVPLKVDITTGPTWGDLKGH